MSENESPSPTASSAPAGLPIFAWAGGIVVLATLSFVLLYAYGDPRPTSVDSTKIVGSPQTIPSVVPGREYYRIRAKYEPLPAQGEAGDPIAGLWISLFGNAVAEAGAVSVKLRLSHPGALSLARDDDGYLLLDTGTGASSNSAATPFMIRRPNERVELRLDISPAASAPAGVLAKLLRATGSDRPKFSNWISVFSDTSVGTAKKLDASNSVLAVRDFGGRVIGRVRIGLEALDTALLTDFYTGGEFERLVADGASVVDRREAVMALIETRLAAPDWPVDLKDALVGALGSLNSDANSVSEAVGCRSFYGELSERIDLSRGDAAGLTFLFHYQPGMRIDRSAAVCGDLTMMSALDAIGAIAAAERASSVQTVSTPKQAGPKPKPGTVGPAASAGRYVCLGLSGTRIARHCEALNDIAREWRAGVKFLRMTASRRHIAPHVGLEEPTQDMNYAAVRFSDRRQLLIHVAFSRVENFACFRLTRENPAYFEALLVMKETEQGGPRRLDVFEFAFESDGRIGRIRRRAAMPSDVEVAMRLPETSRCRTEFLGVKGNQLRSLMSDYWHLSRASG